MSVIDKSSFQTFQGVLELILKGPMELEMLNLLDPVVLCNRLPVQLIRLVGLSQ